MATTGRSGIKATTSKPKAAKAAVKAVAKKVKAEVVVKTPEILDRRVETTAGKARDTWITMQTRATMMTEKTTEALGAMKASFETAGAKVRDVNVKMIDFVAADASFYFSTIQKLAAATSVKEAVEIQGDYFKTQFQTSMKNMQALTEMAQGNTADMFKPIREKMMAGFPKMFSA